MICWGKKTPQPDSWAYKHIFESEAADITHGLYYLFQENGVCSYSLTLLIQLHICVSAELCWQK